eukprot:gnl/Hemi2/19091_TR6325_c0_g1_i1.p3 gnl/Hemi2/19091_TR6325_c0_g1~~gnl/Hemi2/19091_TR6325_c0_g1_i1.p3  ORF type:complete len:135 (-),score=12.81 gnl/Hemi2/19091_TR6325_c0_g1_i1:268-672(-)
MKTVEEADEVIRTQHRTEMDGRVILVERAKRAKPREATPGRYLGADMNIRNRRPNGWGYGGGGGSGGGGGYRDSYRDSGRGGGYDRGYGGGYSSGGGGGYRDSGYRDRRSYSRSPPRRGYRSRSPSPRRTRGRY